MICSTNDQYSPIFSYLCVRLIIPTQLYVLLRWDAMSYILVQLSVQHVVSTYDRLLHVHRSKICPLKLQTTSNRSSTTRY